MLTTAIPSSGVGIKNCVRQNETWPGVVYGDGRPRRALRPHQNFSNDSKVGGEVDPARRIIYA